MARDAGTFEMTFSGAARRWAATAIVAAVAGGAAVGAQAVDPASSRGVAGMVTDDSGAAVARASVRATGTGGVPHTTVSDASGVFSLPGLEPGVYVVTASATGFAPEHVTGVRVVAGQRTTLSITLHIQGLSDSLTVEGTASPLVSAAGSKTDTPLIETPRAISVVTAAQIDAQHVTNIDEVLRYVPGVATEFRGIDRSRTDVSMRGFNWAGFVFTDGMRGGVGGYGELDVDAYGLERVEALRGPASILYGASSPGGVINVVTKRPVETFFADVGIDAGTYNQVGGRFDIGGAVDSGKTMLVRLTGLRRGGDSQVDFVGDSRTFLAPAFTWRPDARTSLTLLATYQKDAAPWAIFLPASGTVLENPNGRIPTSRHLGEDDFVDRFHRRFFTPSYLLEHELGPSWTLRHGLRYGTYTFDAKSVSGGGLAADLRTVERSPWIGAERGHAVTTDTNLQTTARLGASTHRVLVGVDYKTSSSTNAYGYTDGPPMDIFAPVYGQELPTDIPLYQDDDQDALQAGIYAQDQVKIGQWVLSAGGRYDRTRSETRDRLNDAVIVQRDGAFTGQAGLLFLAGNGLAPFVNVAESFEPTSGTDARGEPFVPTTGTQIEGGLKFQPNGAGTIATASVFVIRQQNVLTTDPGNPLFYVQTGEIRARGLELELRTVLRQALTLSANVAFTDTEVTESNAGDLGFRPAQTPQSTFSLWSELAVPGAVAGLRLNGGVRQTGSTLDYANVIEVPRVTLLDAGVSFDPHGDAKGLSLSLAFSNLLDKTYVASCEGEYWCMYGPRRHVTASLRHRW
jgi:iron complex outermembrane recepter protein